MPTPQELQQQSADAAARMTSQGLVRQGPSLRNATKYPGSPPSITKTGGSPPVGGSPSATPRPPAASLGYGIGATKSGVATAPGAMGPRLNQPMQSANGNAAFNRPAPQGDPWRSAGAYDPSKMSTMPVNNTVRPRPGTTPQQDMQYMMTPGMVSSQDMVDIPGIGQVPRSLAQMIVQRYQQRQGPQQGVGQMIGNGNLGGAMGAINQQFRPMQNQMPFTPDDIVARVNSGQMSPEAGRAAWQNIQAQRMQQMPPVRAALPNDNRWNNVPGGPSDPVPGWQGTPYGNDNIGVGVPQPPVMVAPPPPPPAPPPVQTAPTTATVAGQPSAAWMAEHGYLLNGGAAPGTAPSMPGPPPPVPSSLPGHVWGGGPEAFGAGRSPLAASMGDFYSAYGNGRGPMPTQQQLYDQFNAIQQPDPYTRAGSMINGRMQYLD